MLLEVEDVVKQFSGIVAVEGASIEVAAGEIVGLVGPNGSGKSSLLNAISGLGHADSGAVRFDGVSIVRSQPWTVSELGVRRTFQLAKLPERMTVLEVMLAGASLPTGSKVLRSFVMPGRCRREEAQALARARELLAEMNLEPLADHAAGTLSGGQQKLLSLAAALMGSPQLLLLDEPTAGVNPSLRLRLVEHLLEVKRAGCAILVVEHDMASIGALCDRVYVLDKGRVIASCAPDELADDPRVVEAYLGSSRVETRQIEGAA